MPEDPKNPSGNEPEEKKSEGSGGETPPAKAGVPRFKALSTKAKAGVIAGIFIVGFFFCYLVGTSSFFIKSVVVPQVAKILNAKIEVESVSLSPFSSVKITGISVETTDKLLSAEEVSAKYSLMSIIKGDIQVASVEVKSPVVSQIQRKDGSTNLDPIMEALASGEEKKESSGMPNLNIGILKLTDGRVEVRQEAADMVREIALGELQFDVSGIKNGSAGQGALEGSVLFVEKNGSGVVATSLAGFVTETFGFTLSEQLMPTAADSVGTLKVNSAEGKAALLSGIQCELLGNMKEDKSVEIRLVPEQEGQLLGSVAITGTADLALFDADLKLDVEGLTARALNIIGTMIGYDFGETLINSAYAITSEKGRTIRIKGASTVDALSVRSETLTTNPIKVAEKVDLTVTLTDQLAVDTVSVNQLEVDVVRDGLQALKLSVGGGLKSGLSTADLKVSIDSHLGGAVGILSEIPGGVELSEGTLSARSEISGKVSSPTVKLDAKVHDLKGNAAGVALDALAAQLGLVTKAEGDRMNIENARVDLLWEGQSAGVLSAKGFIDLAKTICDLEFSVDGVDQRVLSPALASALSGKELQSAKVTASGKVFFDPAKESTIRSAISISEVQIADQKGNPLGAPLAADAVADVGLSGKDISLKEVSLALAPTERAPNKISLSGNLGTSGTKVKGNLKVTSPGLDLTPLLDQLLVDSGSETTDETSKPATGRAQAPQTAKAGEEVKPMEEPDAIELPVELLTADVSIAALYLRTVELKEIDVASRVQGSKVDVNKATAKVQGAPVEGTVNLDLGMKGWKYAMTAKATHVPVGPMADSFVPAFSNKVTAELIADIDFKGQGITGTNLKKHLGGYAGVTITNANIEVVGRFARAVLFPIVTILQIPEILKSPLDYLDLRTDFGDGKIKLSRLMAESAATQISAQGEIPIEDNIMDSPLDIPVEMKVSRSVAANMLQVKVKEGEDYAKLPDFVKVTGTVGEYKPSINKLALGSMAIGGALGRGGNAGVNAVKGVGGVVGDVGGALGGLFKKKELTKEGETKEPTEGEKIVEETTKGLLKGIFGGGKKKE